MAVVQERMEGVELVLVDQTVCDEQWSELIGEQLPLGHAAHGIGVDLDRFGVGGDVDEAGGTQPPWQRPSVVRVVAVAGEQRPDGPGYAAVDVGGRVGHYVAISTGQVYLVREGCPRPARESDYQGPLVPPPQDAYDRAQWDYGIGKRGLEDALARAWQDARFPATRLRIPMVNGERDHFRRIERYLFRLLDGGPLLLPGGGEHRTRHVYSGAVAKGILGLLLHVGILAGALAAPSHFLFPLGLFYMTFGVARGLFLGLLERNETELQAVGGRDRRPTLTRFMGPRRGDHERTGKQP